MQPIVICGQIVERRAQSENIGTPAYLLTFLLTSRFKIDEMPMTEFTSDNQQDQREKCKGWGAWLGEHVTVSYCFGMCYYRHYEIDRDTLRGHVMTAWDLVM